MVRGKSNWERIPGAFGRKWCGLKRRLFPSIRERYRLECLTGPIGYWDEIQKYQFDFLRKMGLKPHHAILDIGCGPLSGGLSLIPYLQPGRYVGIDVRKEPISEAHNLVAKTGLADRNPLLLVSTTFGRDELGDMRFDYIWASQILYHLDETKLDACFEQVAARMKEGSRFYGDIIGTPNKVKPESRWNGFEFHLHSIDTISALAGKHRLAVKHLGKLLDCGYPDKIALKTSDMLELRPASPGG